MSTKNKHVVFLTGAGMSAESGIKTFRGNDGLWENYPVMQVASHEGWLADPNLVNQFYNERRQQLFAAQPNKGHQLIAELEKRCQVTVITRYPLTWRTAQSLLLGRPKQSALHPHANARQRHRYARREGGRRLSTPSFHRVLWRVGATYRLGGTHRKASRRADYHRNVAQCLPRSRPTGLRSARNTHLSYRPRTRRNHL